MDIERMRLLMAELGPQLDPLAIVEDTSEQGAWGLQMEEDVIVTIEHDPTHNRFVLMTELGTPPEERRAFLSDLLLKFNANWRETGSVRMAVDAYDAQILQIADVSVDGLDSVTLLDVVQRFIEKAALWREAIASDTGDSAQNLASPGDPGLRV